MADLTGILGDWRADQERIIDAPERQLIDAIAAAGLEPPKIIELDGKLHRFNTGTKGRGGHGDKTGWYIAFGDGVPAGRFGCWRAGVEQSWRADVGRLLTVAEEMALTRRMDEAKKLRDAEREKQHETAANIVGQIWSQAAAASAEHPYLSRKQIAPYGARITGDGRLVVPLYGADGQLESLQYIGHDGDKRYHPGGSTRGGHWLIGDRPTPDQTLYIAEGFATAATIHAATGSPCIVAYSASNLPAVTEIMRNQYGEQQQIVIVADNDLSGTGQKYADQASAKHGARVVMPPIEGMDANDFVLSGEDLATLLQPPDNKWLIPADDFSAQPAPIKWLVRGWLQDQALIMVHGPSGGGKTFLVLHWCLAMAGGLVDWEGHKVHGGPVVYLAGEGHHGLRGRIAAWKHYHNVNNLTMWLSSSGCNLNTAAGYALAAEQIQQLQITPKLIVVDTLHRFLSGDENSAMDAKTMLDSCAALMQRFGCSVLLVHHTGVSDEAQHRARGSSAWRGALDIEISVVPGKKDQPINVVQRKSKDSELAEPVWVELQSVTIPGWIDEDGEPVRSAVVVSGNAPAAVKKESKTDQILRMIERAWWASGAEIRDEKPYVSRSAFRDLLISDGASERTAKNKTEASRPDGFIAPLLNARVLITCGQGWVLTDQAQISALLIRKNNGGID